MFERPRSGERAVLVHVELPGSGDGADLEEFRELTLSAGANAVATVTAARDAPDPRHFIGSGKVSEIRDCVRDQKADLVVFDHALSPAQERNLERVFECRVLDRISIILDIFAQRASTFEGKLQVELAQLNHLATRLVRGWTHLERQKGGIGLRGPGEKQLETDRRLIAGRIKQIDRRLSGVQRRRALSRKSRARAQVPVIALVGYTNAGKSTLFNRLTGAGVLEANRLFATLDPTLRRLRLAPESTVVLVDTVGFLRKLPHELVAAFRATLEETRSASLLLHVIDVSDPAPSSKIEQVNEVLEEIGAGGVPQLQVYNKLDALDSSKTLPLPGQCPDHDARPRVARDESGCPHRVWVSAKTGAGIDLLCDALLERVGPHLIRRRVSLPVGAGRLRARLFELGTVVEEHLGENGEWLMDVKIPPASLERLCRSEGLEPSNIAA